MGLTTESVHYGEETGYFCMPERASAPLPALIVLHEAWGLDAHIEDVARRFAYAGYAVLAPDLYARGGVRPPALTRERLAEVAAFANRTPLVGLMDPAKREEVLAKVAQPERDRLRETLTTFLGGGVGPMHLEAHVPSLLATAKFLREEHRPTRGQRVGSIGYCMGGGLSAQLACHDPDLAVAVVYYGRSPPLDLVPRIRCPVFGFYGGRDERITGPLPAFEAALKASGKRFEGTVYEGAQHAFFNDNRPSYDVTASRDAFARTLEILRRELAGDRPQ